MLILFDIDGTMLLTQRAGSKSIHEAAAVILGDSYVSDGLEIAGGLDPQLWNDLATLNGLDDPMSRHDEFRSIFVECFTRRMTDHPTAEMLPGVIDLLEVLSTREGVTLGVLTGNYPETGRMKIEHAGIDLGLFGVHVWGTDGRIRRDLPAVAMSRYHERVGGPIEPERVVVIGDTPQDVDCALHHGCRSLAVCTGPYDEPTLREAGAHLVVADLSETETLARWLVED